MGKLFLLSPESADQCAGAIQPNTCFEVTSINDYRPDGGWYVNFNFPADDPLMPGSKDHCDNLLTAAHLRNGGRWLLLEELPHAR